MTLPTLNLLKSGLNLLKLSERLLLKDVSSFAHTTYQNRDAHACMT